MMDDLDLMEELMMAMARSQFDIPLMILGTAEHQTHSKLADRLGVSLLFEAFADRRYTLTGDCNPEKIEASVYHDPQQILDQAEQIINQKQITSSDGSRIKIPADALCVHGDNQESIETVKSLRALF